MKAPEYLLVPGFLSVVDFVNGKPIRSHRVDSINLPKEQRRASYSARRSGEQTGYAVKYSVYIQVFEMQCIIWVLQFQTEKYRDNEVFRSFETEHVSCVFMDD